MLSTTGMKQIILIALAVMLTIANAEAHPNQKENFNKTKTVIGGSLLTLRYVVIVLLKNVVGS